MPRARPHLPAHALAVRATEPLDEYAGKQVLRAYGLSATQEVLTGSLDETPQAAEQIGYTVVFKTASGDLHKTERGGVRLDLANPEQLGGLIAEIDVNPLIALPDAAVVVDALIVPKARD